MTDSNGFAWDNMFVRPEEDPRREAAFVGERAALVGFLRDQRLTLEMKCAGLTPEQLACRSAEPSTLSLLGLVRHMAEVERMWFRHAMAGLDVPYFYRSSTADRDAEFDGAVADPKVVDQAWRDWREEVAFAERLVADAPDLDLTASAPGRADVTLRNVLIHMIEEYARHNGHADLLRERIDGRIGQ